MDEEEVIVSPNGSGNNAQDVAKGELSRFLNPKTDGPVSAPAKKPPVFSPYTTQANWKIGSGIVSPKVFMQDRPKDTSSDVATNTKEQNPQIDLKKPIIRTYKSDMEETIQSNHLSSINMALAENKRMMNRIDESKSDEKTQKKNYTTFIIIIILIILGILAISIPYLFVSNKYEPINTEEPTVSTPAIVVDSEEVLDIGELDTGRIAKTLAERSEQVSVKLGAMRAVYLVESTSDGRQLISAGKFLNLIKAHLPTQLSRTLKPTYMFGIHNFNGLQKFLILKVGSFDIAYAGMLEWETDLWKDFKVLFNLPEDYSEDQFVDEVKDFQDFVVKNKDTRSVSENGEVVFLYSIPEQDTIVITTSQDTFREILSRMNRTVISQ